MRVNSVIGLPRPQSSHTRSPSSRGGLRPELFPNASHRSTRCFGLVQDIDVASSREPLVQRLDIAKSVLLTFRGLRNANVRDRDTRVTLTLPGPQAARLWRLLGEQLTDA